MDYMKESAYHHVEETQSTVTITRKQGTGCEHFKKIVEQVLAEHLDAITHIDSESGSYDKVIILK
ncbi:putative MarR family transcription regulator [Erwinia toletana]|uniref:MarR family transcription regulator n=1 Tax=Winslowiella toletana TaxID=92490 RepID=A0ABS4PE59_9GAMM|nr:hypothetical protein [Winslowiella toletana]MBP2170914.1 putative MarR family transcription regulator [Winslowiella toletana]